MIDMSIHQEFKIQNQQKNCLSSMACKKNDVVLVTDLSLNSLGACGFLGQHVLEQLQRDVTVSEIRGLDKTPFSHSKIIESGGVYRNTKTLVFVNNLLDVEGCRDAFKGVKVVIHCAALVSYEYPPDYDELQKNNVDVTDNVIRLCIEENVERLIFCSTTEVTLKSYIKGGIVAIVVYQRESKIGLPDNENRLLMGAYAVSKLRAEQKVLEANGKILRNEKKLNTVSIRPTLLFGPGDTKFISRILKYGKRRGNTLPRLSGRGGKQQMTYVGNAAWSLLCAKNTLRDEPASIAGLPITITDDTRVDDIIRFCERITKDCNFSMKRSSWWIPLPISYLIGIIIEFFVSWGKSFCEKLPVSPTSALAYMGSVFLYDRSRASIHLDYSPIYSPEDSMELSKKYYHSVLNN